MTKFSFPNPPIVYVREDEANFRAAVERALNSLAGERQSDVPPTFEIQLDQDAGTSTGTMSVRVRNPGRNWLGFVRFKELSGPGDFDATDPDDGSWTTDSTQPFTADVTLEPKHGGIIAVAAPWRDLAGELQWTIEEHRFDSDFDAELTGHEMAFDTAGVPILSLTGDEDAAVHYVRVAIGDDVAAATPGDPSAGTKDGTLSSRQGRIRFDGVDGSDKTTALGKLVGYKVACENGDGVVNTLIFGPYFKRRGDTKKVQPRVQVIGLRSSDTVTVTLTISDPTLAVTAAEFRKKDSGGSLGSFVSTWDSSTGAAGTDAALTRAEDVTSAPGLDARFIWRVTFTDENGASQTLGDEIDLSQLDEVTKTLIVTFAEMVPADSTANQAKALGYLTVNTDDGTLWTAVAGLVFPVGIVLTQIRVRGREGSAGNVGPETYLRYTDSSDTITTLASTDHAGEASPAWETVDFGDHTVAAEYGYYLLMQMQWTTAETDSPRWHRAEIEYLAPDYSKTY